VHLCMRFEQTLLASYLGYLLMEFDQTFTTNGLWECVRFCGQKVKVTMVSNMPQGALFGLVVVTCWWRPNGQWSRNHRLIHIDTFV